MKATFKPNEENCYTLPEPIREASARLCDAEPMELADAIRALCEADHEATFTPCRVDSECEPGFGVGIIVMAKPIGRGAGGGRNYWRVCYYQIELHPNEKKCRSCKAPIVWLRTAAGKTMPVNPDTVAEDCETYDAAALHTSHFATCPNASRHRGAGAGIK